MSQNLDRLLFGDSVQNLDLGDSVRLGNQISAVADYLMSGRESNDGREVVNFNQTFENIPGSMFFTFGHNNVDVNYIAAQLAWYAKGQQKLLGINRYRPAMWERITRDAGVVKQDALENMYLDLHSNYGEYVFREGQLDRVIKQLNRNPMSRQAIIIFNNPAVLDSDTKDHICTTSMQFIIRDGLLHGITTMRSNELWNGFRFDVAFFTFLMDYVRAELNGLGRTGIKLGNYYHNVGSFHINSEHLNNITGMNCGRALHFPPLKPGEGPALIRELPYIEEIARKAGPVSKGLRGLVEANDWQFYHTIVNLLFNA